MVTCNIVPTRLIDVKILLLYRRVNFFMAHGTVGMTKDQYLIDYPSKGWREAALIDLIHSHIINPINHLQLKSLKLMCITL